MLTGYCNHFSVLPASLFPGKCLFQGAYEQAFVESTGAGQKIIIAHEHDGFYRHDNHHRCGFNEDLNAYRQFFMVAPIAKPYPGIIL